MSLQRHSLQTQSVYSELIERLRFAEIENLADKAGSLTRRIIKGNPYWYRRQRAGSRIEETYLGRETPELSARIDDLKTQAATAKEAARGRRELLRQLRAAGYLFTDRRTGRVFEELSRARVFALEGVLVGTHAYRCYSALLGVRLEHQHANTQDVDIARGRPVAIGLSESTPSIGDALGRAERFITIPDLGPKNPPTSWQTPDRELRVDLLTPQTGKPAKGPVSVPAFGAHATALRFLDFLLEAPVRAAVLTGSGVLVRVPTPERFALHKLILAQRRGSEDRDKSEKDFAQTRSLLEVLAEDRPDDVQDVWKELVDRGKKWRSEAMKTVRRLPEALQWFAHN